MQLTSPRYRVATSIAQLPPVNRGGLTRDFFAGRIPANEQYRPHFGRGLNLDTIDACIRSSNSGIMHRITDLSRETISLDGYVIGLLTKRLNRLAALEHQIEPASGPGIDEGKAKEYAAHVRENINQIPAWKDRLVDLAWGVFDGRSGHELEWSPRGRLYWMQNLHWIHPRRISFGPDRDLRVIDPERQVGNFYDVGFPIEAVPWKFCSFRPRMFGDYQEREGLAYRTLYWSFFARCGTRERLELMEIFGKPWRILTPKTGPGMPAINVEALQQGFTALTMLGFHNTARMPANVDVQIVQPEQGAGQVHSDVVADAREVLSVMYTGHTITTNSESTGLGSGVADNARDAFELIIASDAGRMQECVEDNVTDAMIAVNYGSENLSHAPKYILKTKPPQDSGTEADNIGKALGIGLRVAEEEARKRVGVREVRADEPYIVRTQRPAELGQVAPPISNEIVYPPGKAPAAGELIEAPGAAMNGLDGELDPGADPSALPGAARQLDPSPEYSEDPLAEPDVDEVDDVAELAAQMTELQVATCEHGRRNRCPLCGVERKRKVSLDASGAPVWAVIWKPIGGKVAPSSPGDTPRAPTAAARPPASPAPGSDTPSPRAARDEEPPEPSPAAALDTPPASLLQPSDTPLPRTSPGTPSPMDGADGACPECGAEPGSNIDCETCMADEGEPLELLAPGDVHAPEEVTPSPEASGDTPSPGAGSDAPPAAVEDDDDDDGPPPILTT